jgi:hypothetical protein
MTTMAQKTFPPISTTRFSERAVEAAIWGMPAPDCRPFSLPPAAGHPAYPELIQAVQASYADPNAYPVDACGGRI